MYDYDRRTAAAARLATIGADDRIVTAVLERAVVKKTVMLIAQALEGADNAVRNVKFNESLEVDDLKKIQKPLTEVAAWMSSRHEPEAPAVKEFAEVTSELIEKTSFWNRPMFLNKDRHTTELEGLYKRMRQVKDKVMKAFRASGAWTTTAPAF